MVVRRNGKIKCNQMEGYLQVLLFRQICCEEAVWLKALPNELLEEAFASSEEVELVSRVSITRSLTMVVN